MGVHSCTGPMGSKELLTVMWSGGDGVVWEAGMLQYLCS